MLEALRVAVVALGLAQRTLVPVQPEPFERVEDLRDRLVGGALAVGVLEPQHELVLGRLAGQQPVVECRPRAADVQEARRAGREPQPHAGTRDSPCNVDRTRARCYAVPARCLIGAHVSAAGGLAAAVERAEAMGAETMQIFNQSPRAWRPPAYGPADFAAFRERIAASPVQSVFIHAVYLINVCSDDAEVRRKSLASLTHALRVGDAIGAAGVVVHPGSGKGLRTVSRSIGMIARAFRKALAATDGCPLLLENTAGAGGTIGRTFEELGELVRQIDDDRIGVCLDSCHLLASGYEIRTPEAMSEVVDECDRRAGPRARRARCT